MHTTLFFGAENQVPEKSDLSLRRLRVLAVSKRLRLWAVTTAGRMLARVMPSMPLGVFGHP